MAVRQRLCSPDQLLFLNQIDELERLFKEDQASAAGFARWMLYAETSPARTDKLLDAIATLTFDEAVLGFCQDKGSLLSAFADKDDFMRLELLIVKGNVSGR
jgi:hypothetical protein